MASFRLDVGGAANLPRRSNRHAARGGSVPFALWKKPAGARRCAATLARADAEVRADLAVTMTGELCDCFATKREGVQAILDAVTPRRAACRCASGRLDGRFVDVGGGVARCR